MPDSAVIQVMRSFKADLLRQERAQMREMAQAWLGVERRLQAQIDALALEMDAIRREGGRVSQEVLFTQVRYRELLIQLTDELEAYSDVTEVQITAQQRRLARLGIAHGEQAIRAGGIRAGFGRLPVEAVENLVGLAGNGSPLRALLVQSWPVAAQGLTQELINGVALGYNPRKTARLMAAGMGRSLDRMMVIARTEPLRVYKEANRQSYIASGVVSGYRRIATHDRRVCFQCLILEGTLYQLDEVMPGHPQCRCTLLPVVIGVPQPKWQQGADWFQDQSAEIQKEILGKSRYYAWQNGDAELTDFVQVVPNAVWGDNLRATPLRDLVGV